MKIYELTDNTSDEQYYTIGLFLTMEEAIAVVDDDQQDVINELGDDYASVTISERQVGKVDWSGTGVVVWERAWAMNYNESEDVYKWEIVDK